jgi:hypothetical protein
MKKICLLIVTVILSSLFGSSGKSVGDFFIFISPATYKSVFLTSDIPHLLNHKPFSV